MNLHGNARTCPRSRLLIVERVGVEGWTVAVAAQAAGVGARTAAKWLARSATYQALLDDPALHDRR